MPNAPPTAPKATNSFLFSPTTHAKHPTESLSGLGFHIVVGYLLAYCHCDNNIGVNEANHKFADNYN